ncbi:hypothetical protein VBJ04_17880 [Enterobacter hormaechei]|uniref:hypothetical protein n=1 Tax=Enterobacter hormaechei TaxID=158836 RepID=UPI0007A73A07|nr:hypothetical protein [Enterobacter hormaechei]HCR1967150.1 hypothetical protein [Enterobacter hormaechei subsp. xiangfangensis]MBJ6523234.1 hypothetical protein [Enterobacter hormaechei]MBK4515626.1 hypothetical protein [Enterobacter hormaechei]MEA3883011.1 hypothetical protein [Enterobacter hormaechei]MEA3890622.1 hypothetical protein [Enterobacter hormaechei]
MSDLVKRGHDQVAELKSSCGAVDVRDVAQLISDLATQLDVQLARSNALAAENAGLKESRKNLAEFIHDELNADYPLNMDIETPATDAFLAEVRAQVWIEGNQPAEFGRYWVRYETDVGPRYCSAQWMEHNFCAGSDTNIHRIWLADHSRSINSLRGVTHYTQLPTALESSQLRKGVQS